MDNLASNPHASGKAFQLIQALLVLMATVFLALHALHLNADFPNHSPWMDWAKYTDEGWYGDAAIRHFQRGHWYVFGDFNPAAALPVWPALELVVFRFAGVSLAAARGLAVGIFALTLVVSFLLLRRWRATSASLAPAIAVLLLAVSPFCYAFSRMAILEPLLILLTLLALLTASATPASRRQGSMMRRYLPTLALGVLLPLMVLTKTTAVFLFPSIAWMLWASAGYRLRPFLRAAFPSAVLGAALWIGYFGLFVRPHFLADYRYLFSANAYTGITLDTAWSIICDTVKDGLWIGKLVYPVALFAALASFALLRRRFSRPFNPLIPSLLLWTFGYAAFLAYHNNLQPRYYLVLAVPLILLIPLVFHEIVASLSDTSTRFRTPAVVATALVLGALVFTEARQTLHYVSTPEYTFASAAAQLHQIVASDPKQNPLVLSISGSDLSLMTGLPSICDDFGTMDLAVRVATYHPGWYATWNQVDDDKMEALAPLYRLQRVASFPVMDDPDRNLLILYRLDPATSPAPPRRLRKLIPRLLQTSIGQQPSVTQLEH